MRDSFTKRNHCPSHEMWSYERGGRSSGVLLYWPLLLVMNQLSLTAWTHSTSLSFQDASGMVGFD